MYSPAPHTAFNTYRTKVVAVEDVTVVEAIAAATVVDKVLEVMSVATML